MEATAVKIAICDDQKEEREQLKEALYRLEKDEKIEFTILEYDSPEYLYEDCIASDDIKIVFLDVYMENVLGTDVARKIRALGYRGSIVFCTSSKEHALEGFRVQADGYLVKPYTDKEFREALIRLAQLFHNEVKRVSFVSERIEYDIPITDVIMIETSNKGCVVHTVKEDLFTWTKLKEFAENIDADNIYQVGRFSLVNMDAIEQIKDEKIILNKNLTVNMPKREITKIKQDINDYIWNSMRK